ncbi:hypothetical protein HUJ04_007828 [Dendroctonus ponderosae]|nr:hypothetical protein HUJ04_007828 [Dendroctonus ponderosae]KAH1026011.1 hypothetical protein HUJ05_010609 [Dendroctonus ponderosae]
MSNTSKFSTFSSIFKEETWNFKTRHQNPLEFPSLLIPPALDGALRSVSDAAMQGHEDHVDFLQVLLRLNVELAFRQTIGLVPQQVAGFLQQFLRFLKNNHGKIIKADLN